MKQHIRALAMVLLLAAVLPLALLLTGASLPSYYAESYYAELSAMYEKLSTTEGKKIVVIGGSNVAFGLDGEKMESLLREQGFDYTVCPFGLYAAVGASAMLDLAQGTLGEGDVVVLAFEPTMETMSTYFGATAFWKCAEDHPELALHLDKSRQAALFGSYIPYLQERWAIRASGMLPAVDGVYAKASFDERCDMVYDRPGNIMALGFDTGISIDLGNLTIEEAFAEQVNAFCRKAAGKGAAVVMSFSPMNRSALTDASEEAVGRFFTVCNETFACPIISNPNDYIMDAGWFYDNNFHLNTSGAQLRSQTLTKDILAYLGYCQPVSWTQPVMPPPAAEIFPERQGDADCFTFEAVGDGVGWLVSGLTEEGSGRTALRVPSAYEGKLVVGITPDALKNAASLTELTLPESIESLPDGMFRECPRLTRLVLEHRNKPCAVGAGTFDGADQVKIFVPRDAYPLYRDGAGCEGNPWSPYLDRIFTD